MNSNTKILIIIVTWNKKDYVIDLLMSLSSLSFPRKQLDILVVDNASSDGTVDILKEKFKDIKVIANEENLGGTGGFNTGLSWAFSQPESSYDYLWLLDNDVVVHENALSELVSVLDSNPDVAIAGSTMMQLDFPWRINEMGAFVDRDSGVLGFNRHYEDVSGWQGLPVQELLHNDKDLSQQLVNCQEMMDVDYVAAASLLIRAPIAKQAGLWMDFFIHFDDVEWCLRIAESGHRVVVSAKSLIWHLSAIAKVPSWILYYDNRNILYLLEKHSHLGAVKNSIHWTLKKALYYTLLGKTDLSALHMEAIEDYQQGLRGKKDIKLPFKSEEIKNLERIFSDKTIKTCLIPWTINFQASEAQAVIVKALSVRTDFQVYYLIPPAPLALFAHSKIPGRSSAISIPKFIVFRYFHYFKLRNKFDLVIQSDYQPILALSWLGSNVLFINDENFCLRPKATLKAVLELIPELWRKW